MLHNSSDIIVNDHSSSGLDMAPDDDVSWTAGSDYEPDSSEDYDFEDDLIVCDRVPALSSSSNACSLPQSIQSLASSSRPQGNLTRSQDDQDLSPTNATASSGSSGLAAGSSSSSASAGTSQPHMSSASPSTSISSASLPSAPVTAPHRPTSTDGSVPSTIAPVANPSASVAPVQFPPAGVPPPQLPPPIHVHVNVFLTLQVTAHPLMPTLPPAAPIHLPPVQHGFTFLGNGGNAPWPWPPLALWHAFGLAAGSGVSARDTAPPAPRDGRPETSPVRAAPSVMDGLRELGSILLPLAALRSSKRKRDDDAGDSGQKRSKRKID
ncbi:unnamed protein product [Mycena citricolor]|uniref:Uncharacterized protein n=1 Tax=Mycena citricolor TaxID=2018698 RepID=A0AAD2Q495_9AGAR|nr:unnamed protein product [Mycena citricolor]